MPGDIDQPKVVVSFSLQLINQRCTDWEPCDGCPADPGCDPHTRGTLGHFLSRKANDILGGFASCGGGHTWKLIPTEKP